jgi:hypothetical protein
LILSADRTPAGLQSILLSVDLIVSNLLQQDILIRGGMAVGGVHHDQEFVYGAGVNEAYRLEQLEPHDPCVILSDVAFSDLETGGFRHYVDHDQSRTPARAFLHYLFKYAAYNPHEPLPGMEVLDGPATRIIRLMAHRLHTHSGRVLEKARWFQAYWNRTVASAGVFGRIEGPEDCLP